MRYSYVEPDGETYDISDIVEEEWREGDDARDADGNDLLEGALARNKDGINDRLDRVLNKVKVKDGKSQRGAMGPSVTAMSLSSYRDSQSSVRSAASEYSEDSSGFAPSSATTMSPGGQRVVSPVSRAQKPGAGTAGGYANAAGRYDESKHGRARNVAPAKAGAAQPVVDRRQGSVASVASEMSG
jgi:hypothetical protein